MLSRTAPEQRCRRITTACALAYPGPKAWGCGGDAGAGPGRILGLDPGEADRKARVMAEGLGVALGGGCPRRPGTSWGGKCPTPPDAGRVVNLAGTDSPDAFTVQPLGFVQVRTYRQRTLLRNRQPGSMDSDNVLSWAYERGGGQIFGAGVSQCVLVSL